MIIMSWFTITIRDKSTKLDTNLFEKSTSKYFIVLSNARRLYFDLKMFVKNEIYKMPT